MNPEHLSIRLSDAKFDPAYVEQVRRRHYDEGAKKLMLAVLQEALNNFVQYAPARDAGGKELFNEVETWFLADNGEWLFSFANIAESLGINPYYLREGLVRMKGKITRGQRVASTKTKPFRIGRTAYRTRYTGKSHASLTI